jgi:hypothetical protein
MNGKQGFNRFQFDYNLPPDDDVHDIAAVKLEALVHDRQHYLRLELQTSQLQLMTQALLISGVQQTRPKLPMNLYRALNNLPSKQLIRIGNHYNSPFSPCLCVSSEAGGESAFQVCDFVHVCGCEAAVDVQDDG